jgi:hypothetical protein
VGCRKNSPGEPCCDSCPTTCTEALPSYYDVSVTFNGITKVVRIYQMAGLCNFVGSICWEDESTIQTYVCLTESVMPQTIEAVTCPTCNTDIIEYTEYPFGYTTFEPGRPEYSYLQTRARGSYKMFQWRKRRYTLSVVLRQIAGTSMRLQVSILTEERIRYTYSECNKYSYRKITVPACPDRTCVFADGVLTCDVDWTTPPEPTLGPWIGDGAVSEATDPQDPFGDGCPAATAWPYSDYFVDRGPLYTCPDTTTPGTVTIRFVRCNNNESWGITDNTFPTSIGEQCCDGVMPGTNTDSFLVQEINYFSEPLECDDLCGETPVYRETPTPEDGVPTDDIEGGPFEDPNIILPEESDDCESTLTKTRSLIARPATFNATIC